MASSENIFGATIRVALTALLCFMVFDLLYSEHGWFAYQREQQQLFLLQSEIERLNQEMEQARREVYELQERPEAIERYIRSELSYVYPDETMVLFSTPPDSSDAGISGQ